jgi:nitrate/nitrite transporter NarK
MIRNQRSSWTVLLSVWLLAVCGSAYLIAPAGILPTVLQELAIGAAAGSWIISIPYAAEAVVGVPAGYILDRLGSRRIVVLAVCGLVTATAWGWLAGLAGDYPMFLASRFLGGMAFATLWIGGLDLAAKSVDHRSEATALGLFTTSGPAGLALGLGVAPTIAIEIGWAKVFLVLGLLLLLALGGFVLASLDHDVTSHRSPVSPQPKMLDILTTLPVWMIAIMAFAAYSLLLFFTGWMPSYLSATFGLSLAESGLFVALFPAVGVLSRSGGGVISDHLLDRRRRPVARASFFITAPTVIAVAIADHAIVAISLLVVAGFFVQLAIGVLFSYARELVPEPIHGTTIAFVTTTGILGSFTAPIIAGTLIEQTGTYGAAFGYAAVLAIVGLFVSWLVPETANKD